jgi:hypothetical protein
VIDALELAERQLIGRVRAAAAAPAKAAPRDWPKMAHPGLRNDENPAFTWIFQYRYGDSKAALRPATAANPSLHRHIEPLDDRS